jgi:hypothetical protein
MCGRYKYELRIPFLLLKTVLCFDCNEISIITKCDQFKIIIVIANKWLGQTPIPGISEVGTDIEGVWNTYENLILWKFLLAF